MDGKSASDALWAKMTAPFVKVVDSHGRVFWVDPKHVKPSDTVVASS